MATSAKKMVGASDDFSSSDEEELKRCREAVWETRSGKNTDEDSSVKQSKRVVVDDHEHDGNELQVTQGFRTHVANKLEVLLDSCITEQQCKTSSFVESTRSDDVEGFRLFSTSIPGTTVEDPPAPLRRRPIPSSSDSDSEMERRLREAAVSYRDLLPSPAQASTHSPAATEPPCTGNTRQEEAEESQVVKKRKKKRKRDRDEVPSLNSDGEHGSLEQGHTQVKVKRKKKKKRKENAEEEASS